jgi:hypothetical protein
MKNIIGRNITITFFKRESLKKRFPYGLDLRDNDTNDTFWLDALISHSILSQYEYDSLKTITNMNMALLNCKSDNDMISDFANLILSANTFKIINTVKEV